MKETSRWYSDRIGQEITVVRWGHFGVPVLIFPTAGGDAEEIERFLMIQALSSLLDAGRIKVYSCDSVAGKAWLSGEHSSAVCARIQNGFDEFVYRELVPAIRSDCQSPELDVVTAGASIGAFNALAALARHPDVFRAAICMSGTYDPVRILKIEVTPDFYFASPLHFLPNLGEGEQLSQLRRRFVLLAHGQGRWEDPDQSWRMARVLGAKGVPNWVDQWSTEYDHDWTTWRAMLPHFLDKVSSI